jgi:hypothetical protein
MSDHLFKIETARRLPTSGWICSIVEYNHH